MSNNVYSFHTRKQRQQRPQLNPTNEAIDQPVHRGAITPAQTKVLVLQAYDRLVDLKQHDEKVKYYSQTTETLSQDITQTVGQLQKSPDKAQSATLTAKLDHLNQLYNQLKAEYVDLLKVELSILYENWPPLFDKFIEGVDRDVLENVLNTFDQQVKGQYDAHTAVSHGLNYMKNKYNLPNDFFNHNAIDDFLDNLSKESTKMREEEA